MLVPFLHLPQWLYQCWFSDTFHPMRCHCHYLFKSHLIHCPYHVKWVLMIFMRKVRRSILQRTVLNPCLIKWIHQLTSPQLAAIWLDMAVSFMLVLHNELLRYCQHCNHVFLFAHLFDRCRHSKWEETTENCRMVHLVNMRWGTNPNVCGFKFEPSKVGCYYWLGFYLFYLWRRFLFVLYLLVWDLLGKLKVMSRDLVLKVDNIIPLWRFVIPKMFRWQIY